MTTKSWIRDLFGRPATRPNRKASHRARPALEGLEDRTVPSTFTVLNTLDDGSAGSLRWAVDQANATAGADSINFDSSVFGTPQTITLAGSQLELTDTTGATTITGPAGGVTVSGGGLSRVFQVDNLVSASISGMTITGGNAGYDYGGGVNNFGTLALSNCTVSGNFAYFGGGGVATGSYSNREGSTTLTNCTVSGNSGFGEVYTYFGTTALTNTIVAGDNASIFGSVSGSNNLIGGSESGGLINGVDGNIVGVGNVGLAPLNLYGGTSLTMPLLPGSPALNAGTSTGGLATDQRGLPRFGAPDIGAFESQGFTFTLATGSTPQSSNIGTAFANPLAVSVTANNPVEPVDGAVIRFVAQPAPNGASAIFLITSAVVTNGQASLTAAPNNILGSYTVAPAITGFSGSFALTNTGTPFASLVVNTTSDALTPGAGLLSLREALAFANSDSGATSAITFDKHVFATPQTIALTNGQLELSDTTGATSIKGPKAGVTVDAGGSSRAFQVDQLVTASISGLTIRGGNAGSYGFGGGVNNYGTLALSNCTVSGNSADVGGGVNNQGTLALTDCTLSGNSAGIGGGLDNIGTATLSKCAVSGNHAFGGGGGVANYSAGALTLSNCTVSGNSAFGGGGVLNGSSSTATLTGCTVSGNSAAKDGGGVLNGFRGTLTLSNCTVSDNSAYAGCGVFNFIQGKAMLSNCTVSGNTSTGKNTPNGSLASGGGVNNIGGSLTMTNCTVSGNAAVFGGGVYNDRGTASLTNCTVNGNTAEAGGGGVFNFARCTVTMTDCTVSGNSTLHPGFSDGGGGVYNGNSCALTMTDCTVSGNADNSGGGGGGVFNTGGSTATLTDCTVKGNSTSTKGGGVLNASGSTATLTNSTVSGNSASEGGGIANQGTLNIASSKIRDNQATTKGGGISTTAGSVTITDSAISNNQVNSADTAQGGGIFCENSVLSMTDCKVNDNQANGATAQGGGIYAHNSTVGVQGSMVNGNKANGSVLGEGGGIYSSSSSLALSTTKVKGNKATTHFDDLFSGP